MSHELLFIGGFLLFIVFILALDLGLFSKREHVVSLKQAGIMSFVMVVLALSFYLLLIVKGDYLHGIDNMERLKEVIKAHQHPISIIPDNFAASLQLYRQNLGIEFLTGYVIEYALSVDNIFVIVLVFSAFAVPEKYYHRVLFWGILGAIIMRFIFILQGRHLLGSSIGFCTFLGHFWYLPVSKCFFLKRKMIK